MADFRIFCHVRRHRFGFTLLEMLAAMAVLVLVVFCIFQVVNSAAGSTKASRRRIDADNEARRIVDRMAADIAGMLDRRDADFLIRKKAGSNDEIYFFAEAPARAAGSGAVQPVSLVGYRVNASQQMERLAQGLVWDAAPPDGPVFLTFSGTAPVAGSTIEGAYASVLDDADKYHVLGEGVIRLEIDFLLKPQDGGPASFSASPFRSGGSSPFTNKGEGLADAQAIIVTFVMIDADSRMIAGDLTGLAGKFADAAAGTTPAKDWQAIVNNPSSLGIPATAAANLRVYQRIFSLK